MRSTLLLGLLLASACGGAPSVPSSVHPLALSGKLARLGADGKTSPWDLGNGYDVFALRRWSGDKIATTEITRAPVAADGSFSLQTASELAGAPVESLYKPSEMGWKCSSVPTISPPGLGAVEVYLEVRDQTGHVLVTSLMSKTFAIWYSDHEGGLKGTLACAKDATASKVDFDLQLVAGYNAVYPTGTSFSSGPQPSDIVLGF
jgi:hypothetical protein